MVETPTSKYEKAAKQILSFLRKLGYFCIGRERGYTAAISALSRAYTREHATLCSGSGSVPVS